MPSRFLHIAFIVVLLLSACERERIVDPGPDTTAPLPPTGVVVEGARDGYIFIGWLPGSERDLRGYVVHRAEGDAGATFTVIDTLTVNFIIDEQRSYDTTYFYYITAIDDAGNESVASATVSARSENRYAPDGPRQLSVNGYADGVRSEIRLSWSVVDEADLAGYRLYRSQHAFSEIDSSLLIAEIDAPFLDDVNVLPGSRYFYAVTAIDHGGWESELSAVESDFMDSVPRFFPPRMAAKRWCIPCFAGMRPMMRSATS
jgi:fibronectin type 3 domain-containing protein